MSLRNRTIKVKRFTAGSRVDGVWVEGSSSEFTVKCSVQPLRPREMATLPEGRRDIEALRIYADDRLLAADETTQINADLVDVSGVGDNYDFEVLSCGPWQNGIIPHHKTIISRLRVNAT